MGQTSPPQAQSLYVFLDESGNFDFSRNGTRYLVFGAVSCRRPLELCGSLNRLKFDLAEEDHYLEYFHASDDRQTVRDRVFEQIANSIHTLRADSLIVEKAKTPPSLRPIKSFYPRMVGRLLRHVLEEEAQCDGKVIVYTDAIPVKKKRRAVEKATKTTLANVLPQQIPYVVLHHDSKSNPYLQVADYVNWAIYRKWDRGDSRSYALIERAICGEEDIFADKGVHYY